MKQLQLFFATLTMASLFMSCESAKEKDQSRVLFDFERSIKSGGFGFQGEGFSFADGIDGEALVLNNDHGYNTLSLDSLSANGTKDFTVQFWMKTTSKEPTVFLSQKDFDNKGILSQKHAG